MLKVLRIALGTALAWRRARVAAGAAGVPGFAQRAENNRALFGTVVIDTALDARAHARHRLVAIVIHTTADTGRHARQTLWAIVVGTPAAPLPPLITWLVQIPAAAVKERPGIA